MKISSPAFQEGGKIPSLYTCDGEDINPPLEWTGVPKEAKSLVLLCEDPDVPAFIRADQMWDHWIVFNILPHVKKIEERSSKPPGVPGRGTNGKNSYMGPCPPDREHRYFFKLFALDCLLDLSAGASKKEVERAMQGHIIAQCHLMGRYDKEKR